MKHLLCAMWAIAAVLSGVSPACADTLEDALVASFETNPTLTAQRRVVRSREAAVGIARAASRPQLSATVGAQRELTRSGAFDVDGSDRNIISGGLDLSFPLFNGGRVRGAIEAERSRLAAELATLRAIEGDVLTEAATAYVDVIRDHAVVGLHENQVRVLSANLQATQATFESGDLTRTDIAQSQARLSLAESQLSRAKAQLAASAENYLSVVGRPPSGLTSPKLPGPLPSSAEAAVQEALLQNPDLIAIAHQARAAAADVTIARAARLPTLAGLATGDYVRRSVGPNSLGLERSGMQSSVGLDFRIPFYQGGGPSAQIRRAQAVEGETLERRVATERAVIANARSQFAAYEAGKSAVLASEVAVAANELALEGASVERKLGTRTVLDELNAEQELLESQVQLLSTRRNVYVAAFQLLNTTGRATAADLGLNTRPLAGVEQSERKATRGWSDWAYAPVGKARATSTASVAAIDLGPVGMSRIVAPEQSLATKVRPTLISRIATLRRPMTRPSDQPGGWQIQLGAFRVEGSAQALYERVSAHLAGKQPLYSQVRDLTRLRVGSYESRAQAESACRILMPLGFPCVVVGNKSAEKTTTSQVVRRSS